MSRRRPLVVAAALGACALAVAVAVAGLLLAGRGDGPAGWSDPEPVPGVGVGVARLAVADDGRMIAAWSEERRGRWALRVAERAPDGDWGPSRAIVSDRPWTIRAEDVRLNEAGDAVALFTYFSRNRAITLASLRPRGADWQAPQALMPVQQPITDTRLALDPSGAVTAAWGVPFVDDAGLNVTARAAGGAWRDPERLVAAGSVEGLHLASAPGRVAVAAGIARSFARPDQGRRAVIAEGPAGGRLRPVRDLPADPRRVGVVALAVGDDGGLGLAWREAAPDGRRGALYVARRLAGGGWSPPIRVDDGRLEIDSVRIALAGERMIVVWSRWERLWREVSIRSAIVDARGALVASPTVDRFPVADIRGPGPAPSAPGPPPSRVLIASRGDRTSVAWNRLEEGPGAYQFVSPLLTSDLSDRAWSAPEAATGDAAGLVTAFARDAGGLVLAVAGQDATGRVTGLTVSTRRDDAP